jgi:hypothetical protein
MELPYPRLNGLPADCGDGEVRLELHGKNLIDALENTAAAQIQLRGGRGLLGWVSWTTAMELAASGACIGVGSLKRVLHLCYTSTIREVPEEAKFWDGRGVIRFWPSAACSLGMVTARQEQQERVERGIARFQTARNGE